ncbi:hypothetical protein [Deinococcus frigens]|uniref:hypothetical protein n=1 Tax=Deinococcus frigens TaxID=249403 RepID=UPI0004954657|nr:hypothetical protein [Deinococcus frigens]
MTQDEPTGGRAALPINPTLTPHLKPGADHPGAEHQPAGQGPAPEHLEGRPASGAPVPDTHGQRLGAQEVKQMTGGGDASMTEANIALESAEGIDPHTED